ncbi:MAG: magnesium transporter [Deltaproteobacteria bacterium]|nr:magnesium transporter [Deltaproteobacteria bacterium]OQY15607.1 MAG: magnesium transporter [Desulfobacterium sp. 4572_20]RLJ05247.1 MAG: magnesium transporter [Candidatus Aenigmarchaeota archaeon]HDH87819.1 magnesium transporter [Desulfobacteraceae bacterium]MBW2104535.1 magnesium transporter [Deltaproteobacteria bacterium]
MTQTDYKVLLDNIRNMIQEQTYQDLQGLLSELHPADLADLVEHLDSDERLKVINLLTPERAGEVLIETSPPIQESLANELDDQTISHILNELNSDDATDIVNYLPRERAQEIIGLVKPEVSDELKRLIGYGKDTAGGIMALEFVSVNANSTIREAIEKIREKSEDVEKLYYVWVVDDYGKLLGVVSMKDLLLEPIDTKIKDIMNTDVISVDVATDQEEIARIVKQYNLTHVPVVSNQHKLIGRITHDDIIDVMEEEASEDISLMAGVLDQEIAEESALKISRARLPWLLLCLLGELLSATVINHFHGSLEKILALSFFIPVVMALGGSTGNQAATVVIRGLATGEISIIHTGRRLLTELWVALINGILCGIVLGIVVAFWLSDPKLGAGIGISLITVILFSGSFGAFVPFLLRKLAIDPALAAGPFITTSNDILGLLIYLSIITLFLA